MAGRISTHSGLWPPTHRKTRFDSDRNTTDLLSPETLDRAMPGCLPPDAIGSPEHHRRDQDAWLDAERQLSHAGRSGLRR